MSDLIDRQAFIENERKLYCEDCDRRKGTKNGKPNVICYEIGEVPCRACWLDDALTDLEDFPTASPWHRVEDGLPKYGQDVLAARLYGADSDGWAYEVIIAHVCEVRGTNYWNATNVTHWMPLPEPPKEDA